MTMPCINGLVDLIRFGPMPFVHVPISVAVIMINKLNQLGDPRLSVYADKTGAYLNGESEPYVGYTNGATTNVLMSNYGFTYWQPVLYVHFTIHRFHAPFPCY